MTVNWGDAWGPLRESLERGRVAAEKTKGIPWTHPAAGETIIYAHGKPPMFRYALRIPEGLIWIRDSAEAASSPHVLVSPSAEAIHLLGVPESVVVFTDWIKRHGGVVEGLKPSRMDLHADFELDQPLTRSFIEPLIVGRLQRQWFDGETGQLQTLRLGSGKSHLQCRIYDKRHEQTAKGSTWLQALWPGNPVGPVWRVEFQMRRPLLKQFGIHTMTDARDAMRDLWTHCTERAVSLRLRDNANITRRTVAPWWQGVVNVQDELGWPGGYQREERMPVALADWYISHMAGCLPALAARFELDQLPDALEFAKDAIERYWLSRDWPSRYRVKSIELGLGNRKEASDGDKGKA